MDNYQENPSLDDLTRNIPNMSAMRVLLLEFRIQAVKKIKTTFLQDESDLCPVHAEKWEQILIQHQQKYCQ
jgi:hypothetical protein